MELDKEMQDTINEENTVKEMLKSRIAGLNAYAEADTELLSYRLAEIMILSKDLYTKLLKDMIDADSKSEDAMWSQITGIRMHLMHMHDCIEDFNAGLLELMEKKDEEE